MATFKGFGSPRWICDVETTPVASTSKNNEFIPILYDQSPPPLSASVGRSSHSNKKTWKNPFEQAEEDEDAKEDANYGPTIRIRNVKFVRSSGLDGSMNSSVRGTNYKEKGKGKETVDVKGIYESILQTHSTPIFPHKTSVRSMAVDVDLTIESDDSDEELLILNPLTRLPYPPLPSKRKSKPLQIPQLVGPVSSTPIIPPIQYGIQSINKGYQMLLKGGWKEGDGLGLGGLNTITMDEEGEITREEEFQKGRKVPIKVIPRLGRAGLGSLGGSGKILTKKEKEMMRMKEEKEKLEKRGLGSRGILKVQKKDKQERADWMQYIKR